MLPPFQLDQTINRLVREEWGRILAVLVNRFGNLQLAEDALQEAVSTACVDWPKHGLPDSPVAWLMTTAGNKAIDQVRRQAHLTRLQPELAYLQDLDALGDENLPEHVLNGQIPDKRLELMFTCCHPALDKKTRVALTLRTLGGLSTEEIARAFLDKPATMAQRLVRARHKIDKAGIAYEVPAGDRLVERLGGVLSVIYFIFNEGYAATSGKQVTRTGLCDEAIRLGRILHGLMPLHTEVAGLLCLMLLHDSRRAARMTAEGQLVPLEHQQRQRWDRYKIAEGTDLLKRTLAQKQPGPYQLQAAISALHAEALDWSSTDWLQIVALYGALHELRPTPVVKLNQAVAVSYAYTPAAALELLERLDDEPAMQRYQPYYAAHADILFRARQYSAAIKQLCTALALTDSVVERQFLLKRLDVMRAESRQRHKPD